MFECIVILFAFEHFISSHPTQSYLTQSHPTQSYLI